MNAAKLRTRFAPSPTGSLHIGGARTALFNYLLARGSGGSFVLRIEDTDRARHQEEAVGQIVRDLRWLGIDWDEGIDAGGGAGPYRQSDRFPLYTERIEALLASGSAYYAFDTTEELEAMRETSRKRKTNFRYPRPDRLPGEGDAEAARAGGRPVVVRFLSPDEEVTVIDRIFGEVTIPAGQIDDFIIRKDDGWPTYHLANVVDDALMEVNLVCRGQEFLGQTWRQVLLRRALGFPEPGYAHLPLILDIQGRKLSKRDGAVEVDQFRRSGYLPEALVSFIALLGWHPGGDRERFSLEELVELFDLSRVGKANARFDRDKLIAFNTDAIVAADRDRLVDCFIDFLSTAQTSIPADDRDLLGRILSLSEGMRTFEDVVTKCGSLFEPDESIEYQPAAVKKILAKGEGAGYAVLEAILPELGKVEWTEQALEECIRAFCEDNGLGMGKVAQPIRVAVTGTTVSPPIFGTLMLLGRERATARIERCLAQRS